MLSSLRFSVQIWLDSLSVPLWRMTWSLALLSDWRPQMRSTVILYLPGNAWAATYVSAFLSERVAHQRAATRRLPVQRRADAAPDGSFPTFEDRGRPGPPRRASVMIRSRCWCVASRF